MKRIGKAIIDRAETTTREELDYLREVLDADPGAFWKFSLTAPLLYHQKAAPASLWHLARLGAVQVEDCGPCVQTSVNVAQAAGVPAATLRAALAGGDGLPEAERDAYLFGRGVAGEGVEEEVRERLLVRLGPRGLVELTFAAATVRIFPAVKRGLGYARSCALTPVEVR